MPRLRVHAITALLALALAGCADETEPAPESSATTPTPTATQAAAEPAAEPAAEAATVAGVQVAGAQNLEAEPTVTVEEGAKPPQKLISRELVKGDGAEIASGDQVSVRYTGVSWSTGEKFDASWNNGTEPFTFPIGAGQVIPGWDEGVAGMRVGGRRLLIIPPDLGYGAEGRPPVIAQNETLIFVVDTVAVN